MSTSTVEETLDLMQQFAEQVLPRFSRTDAPVSA
jgi:hypothetical protein